MTESTYWQVVAQIAPVLGLAVVIEVRALLKRTVNRESYESSRWDRAISGTMLLVAATALMWVFYYSLATLATNDWPSSRWEVAAAMALQLAFFAVAVVPIILTMPYVIGDIRMIVAHRSPWSKESRRKRNINNTRREIHELEAEVRDMLFFVLMTVCQNYLDGFAHIRDATNPRERRAATAELDKMDVAHLELKAAKLWSVERISEMRNRLDVAEEDDSAETGRMLEELRNQSIRFAGQFDE